MTKRRFIIFSLVVVFLLLAGSYVMAQPVGNEATLLVTDGDVTILHSQNFLFFNNKQQIDIAAGEAFLVEQGDVIEVGVASSALLTLGDGTSAELLANSVVEVSDLFVNNATFRVRLSLSSGKIINRVQRLLKANDAYDVYTPSSTASVRGTVFTVDVVSDKESFVRVDEGVVAVQMGEEEVLVAAGFEVTAVTGQSLNVQPSVSSQVRLKVETAVTDQAVMTDAEQVSVDDMPQSETNNVEQDRLSTTSLNQDMTNTETRGLERSTPTPHSLGRSSSFSPTATFVQPTATFVQPTAIFVQPTATVERSIETRVLPSVTPIPPTATRVLPTNTVLPPTTVPPTDVPPTSIPPTAVPPPTATPEPPPPPTDEPKVTLCHKGNTITVDQSSVQAHLNHGDSLGACP